MEHVEPVASDPLDRTFWRARRHRDGEGGGRRRLHDVGEPARGNAQCDHVTLSAEGGGSPAAMLRIG